MTYIIVHSMRKTNTIADNPPTGIGWARHSRHHSEDKQVAALEARGCRAIVRASDLHIEQVLQTLRPEQPEPVIVTTLARLAATRDRLRDVLAAIHDRGCWVVELSTGRTTLDAAQSSQMALDAADELTADARAPTKRQARAMAKKSHEVRNANTADKRLAIDKARRIWHDHPTWSNHDCIAAMPGWTEITAYRRLGARGLAKGRPRIPQKLKRT